MSSGSDAQFQSIDSTTLMPLVRRALDSNTVEMTNWDRQQIRGSAGGLSGGWGVYRFLGDARDQGQSVGWSLVLKAIRLTSSSDDPSSSNYWKREVQAYQSGLLDDLPDGLAAPRCFGVQEQPDGGFWIWMEDVQDDIGSKWPLEHYGVVARHLGQFNGAYLTGKPIPSQPWLSGGWLRQWVARHAPTRDQLPSALGHPLVRRAFPPDVAGGLLHLWAEQDRFFDALDRLPKTFCHMDAFPRNLLTRHTAEGDHQTVAIDWAFTGIGAIGEELVPLTQASLGLLMVEMDRAPELDALVFDSYLQGLRDAGWRADPRLVRLGYTATSALRYTQVFTVLDLAFDEGRRTLWEQWFDMPAGEIADLFAELTRFLLGLADEARELMNLV